MKHQRYLPGLLLGLLTIGTACAQEPAMFEDLDANHNGSISMKEAMAHKELADKFDQIDKNGDKGISVDEYTAYVNKGKLVPEEVEVPEPGAAPVMR